MFQCEEEEEEACSPHTPAALLHQWSWWKTPSSCYVWRALGFGLVGRIWALAVDLCCVHGQTLPALWRSSHSSCSITLGPSSLHYAGAGPLAIAQGMCGDADQVCVSASPELRMGEDPCFKRGWQGQCWALWSTCCSSRLVSVESTGPGSLLKVALSRLLLGSDGDGATS